MCNEKKDFSLLRPFNEEAAKNGESIYTCNGNKLSYQAGPDVRGMVAVLSEYGYIITRRVQDIRMAPLCWVRASVEDDTLKPVYNGDIVYAGNSSCNFIVDKVDNIRIFFPNGGWLFVKDVTYTPHKVKRNVYLLGFIHRSTKEVLLREKPLFYNKELWKRSPQLDTTWEIEE